jgi:hypothetical protein
MNRSILLIPLFAIPTIAQTRPATLPATQAVLTDLSNDDWKIRQKALDTLIKLGPDAKPQIEAMRSTATDPSVQSDLRSALRSIADNQRFGPTLFTYHAKQVKPKDAFDELARQANCVIAPGFPNLWESRQFVPVDMDYDAVPFWLAMKDLCDKTNMMVNPGYNGAAGLTIYPGRNNQLSGLPFISGPFFVVATNISRSRNVNLTDGPNARSSSLNMQLTIFSEPKLRVLRMLYPVMVTEAVDEKGNSLAPAHMNTGNGWSSGNRYIWNASVELKDVPNAGQILKRVKGAARMTAIASSESLEIPVSDAKEFDKTVGGIRVKVAEFGADPNTVHFKLICSQQGADPTAWSMLMESVQNGQLRLLDSQGHTLQQATMGTSGSNQSFEINASFQNKIQTPQGQQDAVAPLKLQWDIPTGIKEINVPFEYKDVPLP